MKGNQHTDTSKMLQGGARARKLRMREPWQERLQLLQHYVAREGLSEELRLVRASAYSSGR